MSFSEETVSVVIGGTSGIGRSVAQMLEARPGRVEVISRNFGVDISDEQSVAALFSRIGQVDHVVVTAGSSAPSGRVLDVSLEDAKKAFDVKFWGSVIVAREASRHLRAGGTITLTSGFVARKSVSGTFVKSAMNAALEATTKLLAKELSPARVNIVSPGLTRTAAYAGMTRQAREQMFADAATSLPAGRVADAVDVAAGYLFAIDNPSVTGSVIEIDGGASIS